MELNLDRVRTNVRSATTEDLLDRATIYRKEMEPAALAIIDAELAERGVSVEQVQEHLEARRGVLTRADGSVIKCSLCHKPAVASGWGWHKLFGCVPLFPRLLVWCAEHLPEERQT